MARKRAQAGGERLGHAAIARICLTLLGVTKNAQWRNDFVFKVARSIKRVPSPARIL